MGYFRRITHKWGLTDIDLFASSINTKLKCVCSWKRDPEATFIDAFTISWNFKNYISFQKINIRTNLQAIAIKIHRPRNKEITICNIYVNPDTILEKMALKQLIDQLPSPFIFLGDLNAHNPMWGSQNTNQKGNVIEQILMENNSIGIINDGQATRFDSHSGNKTCIDLTIVHTSIIQETYWQTYDDLCNSDHYPIIIKTQ